MSDPSINITQTEVLALVGELTVENRILRTQLSLAQQELAKLKEPTNDEAHPPQS